MALLPIVAIAVMAAAQLLAAGAARETAAHAAQAGAMALLQDGEPVRAARAAVPGWATRAVTVALDGRRVRVRVRPRRVLPGLSGLLVAQSVADAGPAR